jgi:hypothetical protein
LGWLALASPDGWHLGSALHSGRTSYLPGVALRHTRVFMIRLPPHWRAERTWGTEFAKLEALKKRCSFVAHAFANNCAINTPDAPGSHTRVYCRPRGGICASGSRDRAKKSLG